ncbi:pyrroline-5-carboxylate reductase [Companilactobacillus sp. RD055328]|uniref:pyrroline-5-carboxylate reductase n=1 Tax=Companilactobacillus sp. RD055328 TaxID=2916634 RepID=UPI001FC85350|nr:pyrroline-5-carboxylate reductase [Companilactobacillus sp. RD055328]GKQ43427.1 pyrroline-5-carboxylate reductase [Companilactobacillus sp. RD055328]
MKVGFIGAGSIGGAMIKGLINSGVDPEDVLVKGGHSNRAQELQKELQFNLITNYDELKVTDIIIVAVGSPALDGVFSELKKIVKDQPVVSVSGGSTIEFMHNYLPNYSVALAIPNTPVSIGEGVTGISYAEEFTQEQRDIVKSVFEKMGQLIEVPESQLGIFGTVAGCSPAFIDVLIEALSDAGVLNGLPRQLSYDAVIQMLIGSAKLAQQHNGHVAELKDQVTSPGGSTIRGVAALEENGFRNALIKAVDAAQNG